MFLDIPQNSQQNLQAEVCNFIKKETLVLVFSCEFGEISKNNFSYRTSPMAASGTTMMQSFPTKAMAPKLGYLLRKVSITTVYQIIFRNFQRTYEKLFFKDTTANKLISNVVLTKEHPEIYLSLLSP